ncbi:hypothetical protein EW146_g8052 [Bondarzewia mesenterica]|uniref:alpha-1,2-Mannosidase n=1 Tax=Bondarzewia mesenterica TaxID=1095465 RepID=A0A4S4LI03_9AGAM|nr:hypothetical protein EW146_g8052 [Bondarzewia mesenterica]
MRSKIFQVLSLALFCAPNALGALIQKQGLVLPSSAAGHREVVKSIFNDSYEAYRKFAFGHDDLSPLSQSFSDGRNGWGASIVDAMSTMNFFDEALNFSQNINFTQSQTPDTVSIFESTIRYVGGLLSAYELSGKKHAILVEKAKELADRLSLGWSQGNVVPFGYVDFSANSPTIATSNIAEAGSLTLEWSRLSIYTGNDTYRKLTEDSVRLMASNPAPLPSLPAQGIDPSSGDPVGGYVTWGGGSDSYFEYLIKYARLTNTNDNTFTNTWLTAVDSSIKTLLKASDFDDNRQIRFVGSHLACFYAGNWLMGGKLTNNATIVNIALTLNDACWNTYAGDATGIGPEGFAFISSEGNFTGGSAPTADDLAFYAKHGYYITSSDYILRPEVLESNFYAWRATGNTEYLDRAASAVSSFQRFLQTPTGYAGINDVNNVNTTKIDDIESFWFAEVLKYLYLTFDDPNHISLDGFVFNTEAHPFIAPPAKSSYGTGIITTSSLQPFVVQSGALPAVSPDSHLSKLL